MLWKSFPISMACLVFKVNFSDGNDGIASEKIVNPEFFNDRSDITQWIIENGGYVNPRQIVRQAIPDDPTAGSGVFATERIDADELLLTVPWHINMVGDFYANVHDGPKQCVGQMECKAEYDTAISEETGSEDSSESGDENSEEDTNVDKHWFCKALNILTRELPLGEESHFGPYVRYLNRQPLEQIPEFWSHDGMLLLEEITDNLYFMRFQFDFLKEEILGCGYKYNELTKRAAMIISTRSDDAVLTPYYELYNHRNGHWLNTWVENNGEEGFQVYTRKTIEKGEEIFNSYNQCNHCDGRFQFFNYGTSNILNDYGFVESYPQRWIFGEDGHIAFDLDEKNDGSGELVFTWSEQHEEFVNKSDLHYLQENLEWMQTIKEGTDEINEEFPNITEDELRTCMQYVDALIVAITYAIEAIEAL